MHCQYNEFGEIKKNTPPPPCICRHGNPTVPLVQQQQKRVFLMLIQVVRKPAETCTFLSLPVILRAPH